MNVPEIVEVKEHLEVLRTKRDLIKEWELPYENILTKRSAAIYFLKPKDEANMQEICKELSKYPDFSLRLNEEKQLSQLKYRIEFSGEEYEKNKGFLKQFGGIVKKKKIKAKSKGVPNERKGKVK